MCQLTSPCWSTAGRRDGRQRRRYQYKSDSTAGLWRADSSRQECRPSQPSLTLLPERLLSTKVSNGPKVQDGSVMVWLAARDPGPRL